MKTFGEKDMKVLNEHLQMVEGLTLNDDYTIIDPGFEYALREGKPLQCRMWEPWRVGNLKRRLRQDNIEISEADIPFIRRILIDLGIKAGVIIKDGKIYPYDGEIPPPRLLFVDIECDDKEGFPEKAGDYAILMIGTTDEEGNERAFTWQLGEKKEEEMLREFFTYAKQFDYIVCWNKDFEQKHFKERCKKLGLWFEWRIFRFVDLAEFYRLLRQKTFIEKLVDAYRDILNQNEKKLDELRVKIKFRGLRRLRRYYEAWRTDPKLLEEVNAEHSYALYIIEKALGLVSQRSTLADEYGLFIDYTHWNSHIVDTYALRLITESGKRWVIPSSKEYKKERGFKGAVVYPPKRGVQRFIFLIDFYSLYNRVIQSYLLDPIAYYKWNGTFTEDGIDKYIQFAREFGKKYGIETDIGKMPLFPAILYNIAKRRNRLKAKLKEYLHGSVDYKLYDMRQKAAKVVLLACYGILGMSSSRWNVIKEISEEYIVEELVDWRVPKKPQEKFVGMVTHIARTALMETVDFLVEDSETEVDYGDTDSAFVESIENIIDKSKTYRNIDDEDKVTLLEFGNLIMDKLKKFYTEKFERGIEIKLEKIIDRGIFGKAQKNYYMRTIWDENDKWILDKDENQSFYIYTKGLPLVRTDRTKFLQRNQRKTLSMLLDEPEKIYEYWADQIKRYHNNVFDHELILRKALHKKLDTYVHETPDVQAAKKAVARGLPFRLDEKFAYIVLDIKRVREGKKTKYVKVSEPIDETLSPEEAVKQYPKLSKKALDYYWRDRVWKNISPFLELVLDKREIEKISMIADKRTSLMQFL